MQIQSDETYLINLTKTKAWDIVFANFKVYKALAMIENEKNYPGQLAGLPDPILLAVRQQRFNTAVYTARSTVPGYKTLLTDRQNMSFMVNVQKWLRDNFRQHTNEVLASSPPPLACSPQKSRT